MDHIYTFLGISVSLTCVWAIYACFTDSGLTGRAKISMIFGMAFLGPIGYLVYGSLSQISFLKWASRVQLLTLVTLIIFFVVDVTRYSDQAHEKLGRLSLKLKLITALDSRGLEGRKILTQLPVLEENLKIDWLHADRSKKASILVDGLSDFLKDDHISPNEIKMWDAAWTEAGFSR